MREKILEKTAEMFQRYGVRSVTMDDLANKIAISKKTIYQHFKDKKEVVKESVKYMMEKDLEQIKEVQAKSKDEIHELVLISQMFKDQVKDMNPSLLFDLKKYHQEGWSTYLDLKEECYQVGILETLAKGQDKGLFRNDLNIEIVAKMRMAQVELGFDPDVFPSSDFDVSEVQMQFFTHFVYGIVTKQGRELFEKYSAELEQTTL